MLFLVVATLLWGSASSFYSAGDDVVTLTPANFDSKVGSDDALWIVEFYAPWYVKEYKIKCIGCFEFYYR